MELPLSYIKEIKSIKNAEDFLFSKIACSKKLKETLDFVIDAHKDQYRKSGEPYVVHPICVSAMIAILSNDEKMVIATLLHDIVEDTEHNIDYIKDNFGEDVANIVEGLTKIALIRDENLITNNTNKKLILSILSFKKLLTNSIKDIRVLIIKLCDRLHNMLTLDPLNASKQLRIAEETMIVYVPIAHRLGIASLKNTLEDLSFKYILKKEAKQIQDLKKEHSKSLEEEMKVFIEKLKDIMISNGFKEDEFKLISRIKHNYSIYLKMQKKGISFKEVLDLLAIRILIKKDIDAYKVLGLVHLNFKPLISRFKDYISIAKDNGYQTLHTTVFYKTNIFEVQIRTYEMHRVAEYGIAAHWKYKNNEAINLQWLNDLQYQDDNIEKFYEDFKIDASREDIIVISPKGKSYTLPRGAVALDFAYEIHTDIGDKAYEAYINHEKLSLLTELRSGDVVKIMTKDKVLLRPSWYEAVKTSKAKNRIKMNFTNHLKEIDRISSINILKTIFNLPQNNIEELINKLKINKIHEIIRKELYFKEVSYKILKELKKKLMFSFLKRLKLKTNIIKSIKILSNHNIKDIIFDYCCHPSHGDYIFAFKEGSKAFIHHKMCKQAQKMINDKKMLFVKWNENEISRYRLIISISAEKGELSKFLIYLSKRDFHIISIHLDKKDGANSNHCSLVLERENTNLKDLNKLITKKCKIIEITDSFDAYKKG